jgi:hypothetical protein
LPQPVLADRLLAPDWMVRGDSLAHDTRLAGSGELGHVQAHLGDDRLGGGPSDSSDLIQSLDRGQGTLVIAQGITSRRSDRRRLGSGDRPDQLLDVGAQHLDLLSQGVDLVEQYPKELGVVLVEAAGQRLEESRPLDSHPPLGQRRERLRITLAGDERLHHRSARDAVDVGRHAGELDERVFEQLLDAFFLPAAVMGQVDAPAGCSRGAGGSRWAG